MSTDRSSADDGDPVGTRVMPAAPSEADTAVQPPARDDGADQGPVEAREPGATGAPAAGITDVEPPTGDGEADQPSEAARRPSFWTRVRRRPVATSTSTSTEATSVATGATVGDGAPVEPAEADGTADARPAARDAAAARPVTAPPRPPTGPRRVRLAVSRVDPWSIMKLAFLLSIAIGITIVIATAVVWNVLNTMQVFTQADGIVTDIAGTESFIDILDYVQFSRVISIAVVIAVVDVVILTAIATLFAFLYNITAALVGGVHVTLTDE